MYLDITLNVHMPTSPDSSPTDGNNDPNKPNGSSTHVPPVSGSPTTSEPLEVRIEASTCKFVCKHRGKLLLTLCTLVSTSIAAYLSVK